MPLPYSPLSIEEYSSQDNVPNDDQLPTLRHPSSTPCNNTRRVSALLFLLACLSGSALLVAKKLFHTSLPNYLLQNIFHPKSALEAVCLEGSHHGDNGAMRNVSIDDVQCHRNAMAINQTIAGIPSHGFVWDDADTSTAAWRPQGITTHHTHGLRRWALISWYGRKDEGYSDRGGRISFVDITLMNTSHHGQHCNTTNNNSCSSYPYVHVLLVDADFAYVADSRKGANRILQFDMNRGLFELPSSMTDETTTSFFGHRYVLQQSGFFTSPTKPSFLSYDVDSCKFVIGTYSRCGPKVGIHTGSDNCFARPENRLVWFGPSDVDASRGSVLLDSSNGTLNNSSSSCWHYFSEMQGAVSAEINGDMFVFVSSSYGPMANSHLHLINVSSSSSLFTGDCSNDTQLDDSIIELSNVYTYLYPPGLEDLHIESLNSERFMWMNTEFGKRMVFSAQLEDISHGIIPSKQRAVP